MGFVPALYLPLLRSPYHHVSFFSRTQSYTSPNLLSLNFLRLKHVWHTALDGLRNECNAVKKTTSTICDKTSRRYWAKP